MIGDQQVSLSGIHSDKTVAIRPQTPVTKRGFQRASSATAHTFMISESYLCLILPPFDSTSFACLSMTDESADPLKMLMDGNMPAMTAETMAGGQYQWTSIQVEWADIPSAEISSASVGLVLTRCKACGLPWCCICEVLIQ